MRHVAVPQREGDAEEGPGAQCCRYFVGNSLGLQPKGVPIDAPPNGSLVC